MVFKVWDGLGNLVDYSVMSRDPYATNGSGYGVEMT